MKKVLIFLNPKLDKADPLLNVLKVILEKYDFHGILYKEHGTSNIFDTINAQSLAAHKLEYALVLGGDGSLLFCSRLIISYQIPVIGINLGQLGVLMELSITNLEESIALIAEGRYTIEKRMVLQGIGVGQQSYMAINDVYVSKGTTGRILKATVLWGSEYIYTTSADGIIISTPTGSTAYNLSAGGSIVYPSLEAIAVTPVNPQKPQHKPILLPLEKPIHITVHSDKSYTYFDGQDQYSISKDETVTVTPRPLPLLLLHMENYSYWQNMSQKFNW